MQKALLDYYDAFNAECRAYGRLKELGQEELAVRVYGYISLPITRDVLGKMKEAMKKNADWRSGFCQGGFHEPQEALGDYRRGEDDSSWRLMGILKDWVGPKYHELAEAGIVLRQQKSWFRTMFSNLKKIHRCGIIVQDVKLDQFVDGKIVDFSCAITIPHLYGPDGICPRPSWTYASLAANDLHDFQLHVVDYWNEMDWERCYPGVVPPPRKSKFHAYTVHERYWGEERPPRIHDRLRFPRYGPFLPIYGGYGSPPDLLTLPPYDPGRFDWRAIKAGGQGGGEITHGSRAGTMTANKEVGVRSTRGRGKMTRGRCVTSRRGNNRTKRGRRS